MCSRFSFSALSSSSLKFSLFVLFFFLFLCRPASAFMDFDFVGGQVEEGFGPWWYSPSGDTSCLIYNAASQSKFCSSPDSNGFVRSFYSYYNGYNSDHMGWMRWGYLDASDVAISGKSLKAVFTGGAYDKNGEIAYSGLEVRSKEQYEEHLSKGLNPHSERVLPGDLTIYFKTGGTYNPFVELTGNDRLSVWVLPPEESGYTLENQEYRLDYRRPQNLFAWYPFVDHSNGDHYYHELTNINMGGWIHLVFDAHPVHNNAGDHNPYSYYRAGGSDYPGDAVRYFDNVHGFALRGTIAANLPSPVMMYIDEMEAYKVTQPENDETIAGIGVGYDPSEKIFDISFCDKYRCADCNATYEVRYSFSPITNANYDSAELFEVINFDRSKNNNNGVIHKPANGYNQIWAALKVQTADRAKLLEGETVYFAVKDISDRTHLTERDAYDTENVSVPDVGNVRRDRLVKTIDYTLYPVFKKLSIKSSQLKSGHMGEPYLTKIETKGGIKPLVFELVSGNLPPGISISSDGKLSGTPQQLGTFSFRVRLSESSSFNQVVEGDIKLAIYAPENCSDGIDNDNNSLVDCSDSACFDHSRCSTLVVDFADPHQYGFEGWGSLLKDTYTNYLDEGPGGMAITVGQSGGYNYQGVAGSDGAERNFAKAEKILVFWYNNGTETLTFTPKISFEDGDRPGSGGQSGTWHFMSEVSIEPGAADYSIFEFDSSTAAQYTLVNVSVNHDNHQEIICDKILHAEAGATEGQAKGSVLRYIPIRRNSDKHLKE